MAGVGYCCHRSVPQITWHTVWLCFGFAQSFRDIEDLLAKREIDVSEETARRWQAKSCLARANTL